MQSTADLYPYNLLLTQFAIEQGQGGSAINELLAVPTPTDTQDYSVPKFTSPVARLQKVSTKVGPGGKPNVKDSVAPTFDPGRCERRALRGYVLDEVRAQPHGDLLGNEITEQQDKIDDLRMEMEIAVKTALDAVQSVSNHNASPTTKWDAASFAGDPIADITAAARQAEINSLKDMKSGNWRIVIPPLVADVLSAFLREKLKYTDSRMQLGGILPDNIVGIPIITPGLMHDTAAAGQTAAFSRVWSSDDVYLVYVDPGFAGNKRSFTAMAQMRWNNFSPSYGTKVFRDAEQDVLRTWVSVDIWDHLHVLSNDGIYVLKHVLSVETS
ncbi:MAG: hypothetical protein EPN91_02110 [Salinibacterium sp.]|nr:MAG: hypothetical protein EPN91_02110 [Salinibacterium sp.]